MPLYDLNVRPITNQWFRPTWDLIVRGPNRLTTAEFNMVIAGIDRLMIGTHHEVTVPGFKAHAIWTGLPWDILYWKAAAQDDDLAGRMLGLMALHAFKNHPDDWCTAKTHYAGHEHENRFYFLLQDLRRR